MFKIRNLLLVLFLFSAFTGFSQNIDIRVLREINLNRNVHMDNTFKGFTNSAGPFTFGTPVVLFGISLIKHDKELNKKSLYIGASVLSSAIISNIFKYSVNRTRPFVTYPDIQKMTSGGSPSFPSGHTSDAFSLATSLTIAYPKWYIVVPAYGWASAVAYSRMDLGVHYPSDVLAGAVIGTGSAFLCYKAQQWINHKRKG
jgi:membrane-associated phospholipid phosphatase